jgi:AcrB/AcrD/AcrF family
LNTLVKSVVKTSPLVVDHQGMFPSATLSFNLRPGILLRTAVDAIRKIERELGKPLSLAMSFQGNASAFQSSLRGEPILIAAALVVISIILGILYENAVLPITILSTPRRRSTEAPGAPPKSSTVGGAEVLRKFILSLMDPYLRHPNQRRLSHQMAGVCRETATAAITTFSAEARRRFQEQGGSTLSI